MLSRCCNKVFHNIESKRWLKRSVRCSSRGMRVVDMVGLVFVGAFASSFWCTKRWLTSS